MSKRDKEDTDKQRRRGGNKVMPGIRNSKAFKQLVTLFVKPMINNPGFQRTYEERLNAVFGTDFRQIMTFVVTSKIKMLGAPMFIEKHVIPNREVQAGELVLIRTDVRTPDRVDVEVIKSGQVFRLSAAQYATLLTNLERVKPCKSL